MQPLYGPTVDLPASGDGHWLVDVGRRARHGPTPDQEKNVPASSRGFPSTRPVADMIATSPRRKPTTLRPWDGSRRFPQTVTHDLRDVTIFFGPRMSLPSGSRTEDFRKPGENRETSTRTDNEPMAENPLRGAREKGRIKVPWIRPGSPPEAARLHAGPEDRGGKRRVTRRLRANTPQCPESAFAGRWVRVSAFRSLVRRMRGSGGFSRASLGFWLAMPAFVPSAPGGPGNGHARVEPVTPVD